MLTLIIMIRPALVVYEYIITIDQELTLVWRRKWTLVTLLLMANRYLMIGTVIFTISPTPEQVRPFLQF